METYLPIKSGNNNLNTSDENIRLHDDILDVLFKHKEEIHKKLIDLRGTFLIDHIAITIIDPNKKFLIFSITPSVEYNLIAQGLWKYDQSFSAHFQEKNKFYLWEKAYSEPYFLQLKQIKEIKHSFTFGFSLSKRIDGFDLIYSYATRSKNEELFDYYYSHLNELYMLGDYSYRLICGIYANYCDPIFNLPLIIDAQNNRPKPFLKLIINK